MVSKPALGIKCAVWGGALVALILGAPRIALGCSAALSLNDSYTTPCVVFGPQPFTIESCSAPAPEGFVTLDCIRISVDFIQLDCTPPFIFFLNFVIECNGIVAAYQNGIPSGEVVSDAEDSITVLWDGRQSPTEVLIVHPICGDGLLTYAEDCEDVNSDCCDAVCQYEVSGTSCPGDGDACTTNDACDGAGTCAGGPALDCNDSQVCTRDTCDPSVGCIHNAPVAHCRTAEKSQLLIRNDSDDTRDKLAWKWLKGAQTSVEEFGTPTGATNYALCVYAGSSSASVSIPAGSPWQPAGAKAYRFRDSTGTPAGAQSVLLKGGDAGRAKAIFKGRGNNLPDALMPAFPLPVTVQLMNDTTDACFEAVYDSNHVVKNDAKRFSAKAP